jgi:hypothetical protein
MRRALAIIGFTCVVLLGIDLCAELSLPGLSGVFPRDMDIYAAMRGRRLVGLPIVLLIVSVSLFALYQVKLSLDHAATEDRELSASGWWESRRGHYNVGLIGAGWMAFFCYAAVCSTLLPGVLFPSEIDITLFTMFFQGIAYLFMMGVANFCYCLGPFSEGVVRPRDLPQFRQACFSLGYWFSVLLPFCIPGFLTFGILFFPQWWTHYGRT